MDNARTTSNRLRTENQELKTETKELKKNLVRWKTCSIPNNWGFKASFPKHIKSYGRGERPTQANHQKQRFRYGYVTPPPPKGERPNGSLSQWSVTSFGFGRNFAGFGKRLCAYSKKVYGVALVGTGGPALAAGRSRPMIFKWLILCCFGGILRIEEIE